MNFYSFNIGDYAKKTRHLSWDEDMAYRRLLDVYYSRESALPADKKAIYRLASAHEKRQREAIDTVLAEFFEESDDGWRNSRCDEELIIAKEKAGESADRRENEKERQRRHRARRTELFDILRSHGVVPPYDTPTKTLEDMVTKRDGHVPVTPPVTRDITANTPNPNPNLNNRGEVVARARPADPEADLERQLREAAGWQNEPSPSLAITGPIRALIDSGADLDLDVLPTIRAIAHKAGGRSWAYFVRAIARSRDTRINAANIVSEPPRPGHEPRHSARKSTVDLILDTVRGGDGEGNPDVRRTGDGRA